MEQMYINDLLNRYSGHTFTETTVGDLIKVELKNASSDIVSEATKMTKLDAYRVIRNDMLEGNGILHRSTGVQRTALTTTNILKGTRTHDEDTDTILIFDGTNFV